MLAWFVKIVGFALVGLTLQQVAPLPAFAADAIRSEVLRDQAIETAIERVAASVVQIQVIGEGEPQDELRGQGPTTGVLLARNGWILTSSYRMPDAAASILVTFAGRSRQPAQLLGIDHGLELALLAVEKTPPNAGMHLEASTEKATVGQTAIALGRVYRLESCQPSVGIISAVDRLHGVAIQTDANTSPANYGGPLISLRGRLLGIVTPLTPAILPSDQTGAAWYDAGIGFAVPPDRFQKNLQLLADGQHLYPAKLGVAFVQGLSYSTPATVRSVDPKSPAAAVIEKGDTITQMEGVAIDSQHTFAKALSQYRGETTVQITLLRDEQPISVEVRLADKK